MDMDMDMVHMRCMSDVAARLLLPCTVGEVYLAGRVPWFGLGFELGLGLGLG